MKKMLVFGAAMAGTVLLTGCEKPFPGATVWSGTNSEHASALCWSFDAAQPIDETQCASAVQEKAAEDGELPRLSVTGGQTVGISVDPVLADNGWIPVINNERLSEQPITSTYWRFTFPEFQELPAEGVELQILAVGENADQLRGIWAYTLVPRASAE